MTGKRRVAAAKRKKWLPEQFQVAAKQPRVREMLQYNVYVPRNTTFTTGLLTGSGSPLPEYRSLSSWTKTAAARNQIKPNTGPIELPPAPTPASPTPEQTSAAQ